MREEVYFTDGKIHVKGKLTMRGKGKKAETIIDINLSERLKRARLRVIEAEKKSRLE